MIDVLKHDSRVTTAAKIAYTFHIDPLAVLKSDYFGYAVRVAAYQIIQQIEAEQAAKAKAEAASRRR